MSSFQAYFWINISPGNIILMNFQKKLPKILWDLLQDKTLHSLINTNLPLQLTFFFLSQLCRGGSRGQLRPGKPLSDFQEFNIFSDILISISYLNHHISKLPPELSSQAQKQSLISFKSMNKLYAIQTCNQSSGASKSLQPIIELL